MFLRVFYFTILIFLLNSPQAFSAEKRDSLTERCRQAMRSFSQSIRILVKQPKPKEEPNPVLNSPVSILNLSTRPSNVLRDGGIKSIWDLVQKTEAGLLRFPNFGEISLAEVKDALSKIGLKLGMNPAPLHMVGRNFGLGHNFKASENELNSFLALPIEDSNLSNRAKNALINDGFAYIEDLLGMTEAELLRVPNFGKKSLAEVKDMLSDMGAKLEMDININ